VYEGYIRENPRSFRVTTTSSGIFRSDVAPFTIGRVMDSTTGEGALQIAERQAIQEGSPVRVSRLFTGAVVVVAVFLLSAVSLAPAAQAEPILRPAKERGAKAQEQETVASADMTQQRKLSLCIDSWDAETHMSKQEWRAACQRSVRDYPDAFSR
jgi:hypothetical protein